ncbi:MAG: RHS repeat-associated core domain-containing protein [Planctomycetota bacterium]
MKYVWDAENRLIAVQPENPQTANDKQVEFTYDYMGRRIKKAIYAWDPVGEEWESTATFERRFVWAGWLMLAEWDDSNDEVRSYTWGLDLSQSLEGAGGIGGLLAVHDADAAEDYVYTYDANGNVGQLVAWESGYGGATGDGWHADRLVAHYDYGPYGNIVNDTSGYTYADDNSFRFSTKPFDHETGLGSWPLRPYDPRIGRWLTRDPAVEAGGLNLYAYVLNDPLLRVDPLGHEQGPATTQQSGWTIELVNGPTGLTDCTTGFAVQVQYTVPIPAGVTHLIQVAACTKEELQRHGGAITQVTTHILDGSYIEPGRVGQPIKQPDTLQLGILPNARESARKPCFVHFHCKYTRGFAKLPEQYAGVSVSNERISKEGHGDWLKRLVKVDTTTLNYVIYRPCDCLPGLPAPIQLCGFEHLTISGLGTWGAACIE